MNLWLRVLRVLLASFFRRRLGLMDESVLTFVVSPTDLDINIHMNNARYLAIMDLGRLDMIVRGGLARLVIRERLQPVIAGAMVRFRRPLGPFQRFCLRSRLLAWDEKWLFIEHRIESGGKLACHAVVKGMFLGRDGGMPPAEVVRRMGHDGVSPPLPEWFAQWLAAEGAMEPPGNGNS